MPGGHGRGPLVGGLGRHPGRALVQGGPFDDPLAAGIAGSTGGWRAGLDRHPYHQARQGAGR